MKHHIGCQEMCPTPMPRYVGYEFICAQLLPNCVALTQRKITRKINNASIVFQKASFSGAIRKFKTQTVHNVAQSSSNPPNTGGSLNWRNQYWRFRTVINTGSLNSEHGWIRTGISTAPLATELQQAFGIASKLLNVVVPTMRITRDCLNTIDTPRRNITSLRAECRAHQQVTKVSVCEHPATYCHDMLDGLKQWSAFPENEKPHNNCNTPVLTSVTIHKYTPSGLQM
jgi:hypothetical protein